MEGEYETAPKLAPLPPIGHIWDVMLVWRKGNIEKNCLHVNSIVYCYNGAQRYEQFLQVGQLYRALILLGLALSSEHLPLCLFFMVLYINFFAYIFLFTFYELSLVGLALDVVD